MIEIWWVGVTEVAFCVTVIIDTFSSYKTHLILFILKKLISGL